MKSINKRDIVPNKCPVSWITDIVDSESQAVYMRNRLIWSLKGAFIDQLYYPTTVTTWNRLQNEQFKK